MFIIIENRCYSFKSIKNKTDSSMTHINRDPNHCFSLLLALNWNVYYHLYQCLNRLLNFVIEWLAKNCFFTFSFSHRFISMFWIMLYFGRQVENLNDHLPDHFHQQPLQELSGCWQNCQTKPNAKLRNHTEP